MAVAKRQGREKPAKIEQRKARGPECGQTALLATPVYTGQAQGGGKDIKRGAKGKGVSLSLSLPCALGRSSLHICGSKCPHTSRMNFPAIF